MKTIKKSMIMILILASMSMLLITRLYANLDILKSAILYNTDKIPLHLIVVSGVCLLALAMISINLGRLYGLISLKEKKFKTVVSLTILIVCLAEIMVGLVFIKGLIDTGLILVLLSAILCLMLYKLQNEKNKIQGRVDYNDKLGKSS